MAHIKVVDANYGAERQRKRVLLLLLLFLPPLILPYYFEFKTFFQTEN